jgi:hypothetical protein
MKIPIWAWIAIIVLSFVLATIVGVDRAWVGGAEKGLEVALGALLFLVIAVIAGSVKRLKLNLLKARRVGKSGVTELMYYAAEGDTGMVRSLLKAGANVNARNDDGATALHLAVVNDRPDVVRELIRYGADASIQSNRGLTATAIAKKRKLDRLREIIESEIASSS